MKRSVLFVVFLLIALSGFAQKEIFSKSEQAINGYDPVAYFKEGRAVKGNKNLVYQWKESNWYFSSEENLKAFKADPEKFAPQFGGFCAYGVSDDHKAPTSPDAWTIVDGKLYLNYNKDVQQLWSKDRDNLIKKANEKWPEVKKEKD